MDLSRGLNAEKDQDVGGPLMYPTGMWHVWTTRTSDTNLPISGNRFVGCGHVFCFVCVKAILDSNTWYEPNTCPLCQAPILQPPKRDLLLENVLSWLMLMKGEAPPTQQEIEEDYFDYHFEEARLAYHRLLHSID